MRGAAGFNVHKAHRQAALQSATEYGLEDEQGTVHTPLAVEFDDYGQPTEESDEFIWNLCKRIGMSSSLIGRKYVSNAWGHVELNAAMQQLTVIEAEDVSKIEIVRALLAVLSRKRLHPGHPVAATGPPLTTPWLPRVR